MGVVSLQGSSGMNTDWKTDLSLLWIYPEIINLPSFTQHAIYLIITISISKTSFNIPVEIFFISFGAIPYSDQASFKAQHSWITPSRV